MKPQIDKVVSKAHGLLGVLSSASTYLTHSLLLLAYKSLIRSHLEYASALLCSASNTNKKKLETIQKTASRIILGAPRNTHSAPLLEKLNLETLVKRRGKHVREIVARLQEERSHDNGATQI